MQDTILTLITELKHILYLRSKGGKGSGGWGHSGRKGKRGGSKAGSGGLSKIGGKPNSSISERRSLAKMATNSKQSNKRAKAVRKKILTVTEKVKAAWERNDKALIDIKTKQKKLYGKQMTILNEMDRIESLLKQGRISKGSYDTKNSVFQERMPKIVGRIKTLNEKKKEHTTISISLISKEDSFILKRDLLILR